MMISTTNIDHTIHHITIRAIHFTHTFTTVHTIQDTLQLEAHTIMTICTISTHHCTIDHTIAITIQVHYTLLIIHQDMLVI